MEIDRIHSAIFSLLHDNFNSAIEECTQVIEKNEKSFNGRLYRGLAYSKKGLYSDAINDFNEAENLQQNSFEVLYHRGIAKFYLEKFSEALEDLEKSKNLTNQGDLKKNAEKWISKIENIISYHKNV